jgi:hypothetical protein
MIDKIQELKDDAKSIGIKLKFSINYTYVTLYHGTSKKSANEIRKSGFFRDGFFFSKLGEGEYGDSVSQYANIRGKADGSGSEILEMKVDTDSFHINVGTSELESDGDLWLWNDRIWRNTNPQEKEIINFKSSKEICKLLNIDSLNFVAGFAMSILRHKYFNLKITNKEKLFIDFKEDLEVEIERCKERPRMASNRAKLWRCTKQEFIDNLNKFYNLTNLDPLIEKEESIKENRLLNFDKFIKKDRN